MRSALGVLRPRYPYAPLEDLLRERFGEARLSQALVEVVIPSYDLSLPGPFFFKRSYTLDHPDYDIEMWRVARATSAAPTSFDAARVRGFKGEADHALVDGGVFANSPSVAAFADGAHRWGGGAAIHVVSIGTGAPPRAPAEGGRSPSPMTGRGGGDWLTGRARCLKSCLTGIEKAVEYQMVRLCKAQEPLDYIRLQSALPTTSRAMDDASARNLQALQADAATLLRDEAARLDEICAMLQAVAADRDAVAPAPR